MSSCIYSILKDSQSLVPCSQNLLPAAATPAQLPYMAGLSDVYSKYGEAIEEVTFSLAVWLVSRVCSINKGCLCVVVFTALSQFFVPDRICWACKVDWYMLFVSDDSAPDFLFKMQTLYFVNCHLS